jgi:phosphoribosylamine--glycine ligase
VGPEIPLGKGIVDAFRKSGLQIIGPTADHARLESSKTFAKKFFKEHGIPTADFWECATPKAAYDVLERAGYPIVLKADGFAAGKGVTIAQSHDEARSVVRSVMEEKTLGEAGAKLVIEEFLVGEEASFHVFADGMDFQKTVVSQDHKRRFDGDAGPNTGGMGAYSIDTILSPSLQQRVIDTIISPTLQGAKSYSGILYAGLMITAEGPKMIEYNARFGDPETQVILPRLKTDLLDVLLDMTTHRLGSRKLEWKPEVTVCINLVAGTYPGKVENGKRISGLEEASRIDQVKIYHAGTRYEDGHYYTAGGRVLNVTAQGNTLSAALARAYAAAEMIKFDGKDYRRDIAKKGLAKEK